MWYGLVGGFMSRSCRLRISEDEGSYHIISRVIGKTGEDFLIDREGKDYLLALLRLCCSAYFVELHSFCIMDNHFHILVSEKSSLAEKADAEDLVRRYEQLTGKLMESQTAGISDMELHIEKLRSRFSDVSRFMQDIKQGFGRWYNKKHERKGTLWSDRFKSILVSKGQAQVDVATYIELNPVRAGIVKRPEDYRWCSLGQHYLNGEQEKFFTFFHTLEHENDLSFEAFKDYVHQCGGIDDSGASVVENENFSVYGRMVPCFSKGIALGDKPFVERVQAFLCRKFICGRRFLKGRGIFSTRCFS
jgi:REP element-mobilizing transposase RayT